MKSLKTYLIAGGIILIIYIVAQFNRPKAVNWIETLSSKDKIPFGTYILNDRLNDIFPGAAITRYRQPIYNVIVDDSLANATYIIICPYIVPSKTDYNRLIDYVKKGNDVFIAAADFGGQFEKKLSVTTDHYSKLFEAFTHVDFTSSSLNPKRSISIDKDIADNYFSKFDTLHAVVLSKSQNERANLIRYTYGKGSLYLCANPRFFSNYSLLTASGETYASTALSFLKKTKDLAFDEYYTQGDIGEESPMRVFLSNPLLQWAYYITLFSLLVFVLYEIKRRQRIIPVVEPLKNSSLEFVNVVGGLYYEKRNSANIAQKKILYFLTWLRDEHQVKTNKLDDEFTEKVIAKFNLERSFARDFVRFISYLNVQDRVSDQELIELNKQIEKFYNQAR